jgi:phospho-N-acetylmuramoyl-pentapeptide-transferase
MMIGKIKEFNFRSLLILNTFALIVTSFFSKNFIFIGVYTLFFFISLLTTKNGLKIIKKFNLLQNIRTEGPANHLKKSDTPTMGGIFMIIPFLIFLLAITINLGSLKLFLLFLTVFGFFITGFLDDYLSIKNKENTGLKTKEKFILQSIISILFILLAYEKNLINPLITISDSWGINIDILILPISFLVLVGISNSVNLTDGLDGLAAGCSGVVFYGLGTEILMKGQQELFVYSILCYSMSGLCLGFLKYNSFPAKIFMGDTGSLTIGAILGSIALLTNSIFTLFIFSGIFIIESLSVMIQVGFFKITKKFFHKGKRIFLMAPLHHHFELQGVKEQKIVESFWKINILLVILGIVLKTNL